ncbi:uncharacterized protein B0I36DRAFT_315387 [Microdochium trichocladiopsis]|uniref:Uncharacterized protein n=1 Tax=Microdochium trichocladiopsis TaxID=1682393 RepID=A0A9P8YFM8_9PEZI|nr:uncharacterized protein B0I36DRAFT_315387 [Microdochium trichocladiopsis]KAH7038047.1 hypothetical protein B0I36DRAFT_315387 [Microdochium trichocladiopsis]
MPRKKRYRTYSQRRQPEGSQDSVDATLPATALTLRAFHQGQDEGGQRQLCPSTPLLRRATGQIFSSPVQPRQVGGGARVDIVSDITQKPRRRGRRKQTEINERLSCLRGHCNASHYADLESIYRAFEALLIATAPQATPQKGGHSLLGICLRRMPDYIAGVEAWEMDEARTSGTGSAREGINTSSRIYNDLEMLGASTGWKHLRSVALADGVRALALAIEEGLWMSEFTKILANLCVQFGALKEAERLLSALSSCMMAQVATTNHVIPGRHDLLPHTLLLNFAREVGRKAYVLEQYRQLVVHEAFSMDWLQSDEFNSVWELAVGALSKGSAASHAVDFLTTLVIVIGQRLPRSAAMRRAKSHGADIATSQHRAVIGALSAMASMSFLGEHRSPEFLHTRERTMRVGSRLRYILRACICSFRQRRKHLSHMGYSLTCLALLCSSTTLRDETIEIDLALSLSGLWSERTTLCAGWTPRWREHFDILVSLVSSIAVNCSRATVEPPQHFLDIFACRLQQLNLDNGVVDALKTASAFHLAQQTNSVRDLIYAENLQRPNAANAQHQSNPAITPVKTASQMLFTGYAWDETIGEWVTATPATTKLAERTPQRTRMEQDSEDSEDDLSLDTIETPQARSSLPITPYTTRSELGPRSADFARFKRQGCARLQARRSLPANIHTSLAVEQLDSSSDAVSEDTDSDERNALWAEDELARDYYNDEEETDDGAPSTKHVGVKRRRTHSDLFATTRNRSRNRHSVVSHTISCSFVGDSSSDDELGL